VTIRRALVTGASSGIGRAFALALAQRGAAVTVVGRNAAALQALAEGSPAMRVRVADLATDAGVNVVREDLRTGGYDLFVNNAGVGAHGAFAEMPLERVQQLLRLNCEAVVTLAHAYLKTARRGDALVNVSSTLGFGGFPYSAVYAASKAFALSFSESLWYEQKARGVYVLGLCPGPTTSAFHDTAGFPAANRPPARIMQSPEDVVTTAFRTLERRRQPTVISGFKNRVMLFVSGRFFSRRAAINLMGKFGAPKA
jgi:short-subunit dehydrogenase